MSLLRSSLRPSPPRPRVWASVRAGLREAAARPQWWVIFLVANLVSAWILTAPLRSFLGTKLDDNLYGQVMASGSSWRWFDTVDRTSPDAFGNLDAWTGLLGANGVSWSALSALSGPAAAIVWAGVLMFWVSAVLHCGFLAGLYPDRRGGIGAATAHFLLPVSAFSCFALLCYVFVYYLGYVQTGRWLEGWSTTVDSEWLYLVSIWLRLALTFAGLLAVKLLFDLSKVVLVDRGTWNWPWAFLVAARELALHPALYARLYLTIGLAVPPLVAGFWLAGSQVKGGGWITLFVLWVAHQIFLLARIGLRLTHLAATRDLYLEIRRLAEAEKPPYKVEVD